MATKCPRTVMTHRELTLPPEVVALICAFKPEEGHIGRCFSLWREGTNYPLSGWSYHECCGGSNYRYRARSGGVSYSLPCRRFVGGMYHPGKLEEYPCAGLAVRWSCCWATFGSGDLDAPVGCTPLDLTLRVTTVTRAAPPTDPETEQAA